VRGIIGRRRQVWQDDRVTPDVMRSLCRGLWVALALGLAACGSLSPTETKPAPEETRATPAGTGTTPGSTPVMGAPAPAATPTPDPSASPTPAPGGGEGSDACGDPLPPPVTTMNVKVHLRGDVAWTLDSTPLVGPDGKYCATIGFTDGRSVCPVRPEGNPQRSACELYAIGRAKDTGRPGPTWYKDGQLCSGRAGGCENHPDNQYLLVAYSAGTYSACANNGTCGEVVVDK
jgi:hypothetical protein